LLTPSASQHARNGRKLEEINVNYLSWKVKLYLAFIRLYLYLAQL